MKDMTNLNFNNKFPVTKALNSKVYQEGKCNTSLNEDTKVSDLIRACNLSEEVGSKEYIKTLVKALRETLSRNEVLEEENKKLLEQIIELKSEIKENYEVIEELGSYFVNNHEE
jgi:geranylgeranyl pyrophosphate synthase